MVLQRSPLTLFAALSLTASAVMAAVPFVSPHTPLGPFIVANWLAFAIVSYLTRQNGVVFTVVLVAFALAGWFAVLNAEVIV